MTTRYDLSYAERSTSLELAAVGRRVLFVMCMQFALSIYCIVYAIRSDGTTCSFYLPYHNVLSI